MSRIRLQNKMIMISILLTLTTTFVSSDPCQSSLFSQTNHSTFDPSCRSFVGDECNADHPCNPADFMQCSQSSSCDCIDGTTENHQGQCRTDIRGSCAPGKAPCDTEDLLTCLPQYNVCVCQQDLVENSQNMCVTTIGRPCTIGGPSCDVDNFLDCLQDECACQSGLVADKERCVVPLGDTCGDQRPPCLEQDSSRTECIETQCVCAPDLHDVQGRCRRLFAESCDSTLPCSEFNFFDCVEGYCACATGLIDLGQGNCRATVGQSCTQVDCDETAHLYCDDRDKICQCPQGTEETWDHKCRVEIGGVCSNISLCNEDKFYVCNQSICQCRADLVDDGSGVCRASFGHFCNDTSGLNCDQDQYHFCSNNKCECYPDMVDLGGGQCFARVGGTCDYQGYPCGNFTECLDSTTQCACLPQYEVGADNVNCHFSGYCKVASDCDPDQFCDTASGLCKDKLPVGSTCLSTEWCGNNTECAGRTCACLKQFLPEQNQVDCAFALPCPVFQCNLAQEYCLTSTGYCELRKDVGETCAANGECMGPNTECAGEICGCIAQHEPDRPVEDGGALCFKTPNDTDTQCRQKDLYGEEWTGVPTRTVRKRCAGRQTGQATWICGADGKFVGSQPNFSNCSTVWVNDLQDQLDNLEQNGIIPAEAAVTFLTDFDALLTNALQADAGDASDNTTEEFFGHELSNFVNVLMTTVTKVEVTNLRLGLENETEIYEKVVGQVNSATGKLLQFTKPWTQLPMGDRLTTFSEILGVMTSSGLQLLDKVIPLNENKGDYFKSYAESTFFSTAASSYEPLARFPIDSEKRKGYESFMELPPSWNGANGILEEFSDSDRSSFVGTDLGLGFVNSYISNSILDNGSLRTDSTKILNANALGFSPQNFTNSSGAFDGGAEIIITFLHDADAWAEDVKQLNRKLHENEKPRAVQGTTECVQWDPVKLIWTTQGCRLVETATFYTKCACDRPTQYSIVNDFHTYKGKSVTEYIVLFITYAATIIYQVYLIIRAKNGMKNIQENMRLYMHVFLALSNILILFFVDRHFVSMSEEVCYFIGFVSHLTTLSALMFLLIVAVDALLFKSYNEVKSHKKIVYPAIGLGVPIFIIIVSTIVGAARGKNSRVYGGDFCWLDGSYVWAFFAPAIVIIVANFFIMLRTLILVNIEMNEGGHQEELKRCRNTAILNMSFSILLGLTWTVGYYHIGPNYSNGSFTTYAFPILTGLQLILNYAVKDEAVVDKTMSFMSSVTSRITGKSEKSTRGASPSVNIQKKDNGESTI